MAIYRTKTYIAGDWDHDKDAVEQLRKWNESGYWSLSFSDAHDLTSSRDSSLNCTIKNSLKKRMDASKTFVLIVGDRTDSITAGGCQFCDNYKINSKYCFSDYPIDNRSYIKFECDMAVKAGIKIIVLYKAIKVDKSKCPSAIRYLGIHIPMFVKKDDGNKYWNYASVKKAFSA